MTAHAVHTLILGAGPAGLGAAHALARAGKAPLVVEKSDAAGGLMRAVRQDGFVVDVGRKELYNRLARVDELWASLLGADYHPYPHRGGVLFDGHIIEISAAFRGFRRGIPWATMLGCAADLVRARLRRHPERPQNLEEYYHRKRGRRLCQLVSQGFQEKLCGVRWADVELPEALWRSLEASCTSTVRELLVRTFTRNHVNTHDGVWRHPAQGTGQICEALERDAIAHGARMVFRAAPLAIETVDGRIRSVTVSEGGDDVRYDVEHVVSTIPAPHLFTLLLREKVETLPRELRAPKSSARAVVLVYLFLHAPPRFPHAWLNVTCPRTPVGRITNYGAIGNRMVPPGKGCLCCEFFCHESDAILALSDRQAAALAVGECARFGLVDPASVGGDKVLRLPGADAAQNRHNFMSGARRQLVETLGAYSNLYYAARTDMDIATLAGLEAADAILSGDRTAFDWHVDPRNLPIRSAEKAMAFTDVRGPGI